MKRLSCLLITVCLALNIVHSQEATPALTPPPDPQVAPLPDKISFVKTFIYRPDPQNPNATDQEKALEQFKSKFPRLEKLDVVKTGMTAKEIQHFSNGTSLEVWKWGDTTFQVYSANPNQIMVTAPGMGPAEADAAVSGLAEFGEFAWVSSKAYHGEEVKQGFKCSFYKAGDQMAWVDQKSRLPVFFQSSKVQVLFTYRVSPEGSLLLPERFTKKLEAVKRAWMGRSL